MGNYKQLITQMHGNQSSGMYYYGNFHDSAVSKEGILNNNDICIFRAEEDSYGRLQKAYFYDNRNYCTQSILFEYNEQGDLVKQIVDIKDDGTYDEVYEYKCKYDSNGALISHKETMSTKWNKFKQDVKNHFKPTSRTSIDSVSSF